MSADAAAVWLILAAAPPATLFPVLYAWVARGRWWKHVTGRALMTSSVGLALLIDIFLVYQWLGDDYALRDEVRLAVFAIITAGAYQTCYALVSSTRPSRRSAK